MILNRKLNISKLIGNIKNLSCCSLIETKLKLKLKIKWLKAYGNQSEFVEQDLEYLISFLRMMCYCFVMGRSPKCVWSWKLCRIFVACLG